MAARHRFSHQQSSLSSWNITNSSSPTEDVNSYNNDDNEFENDLKSMIVASRDRTIEFQAVIKSIKRTQLSSPELHSITKSPLTRQSGFSKHSNCRRIGQDLAKTFEKLEKLTLLCYDRELFNDRPVEIQELTCIIRQDITSLKRQIQQLEENKPNTRPKHDHQRHSTSVIRTLRATMAESFGHALAILKNQQDNSLTDYSVLLSKLASMSENFKAVLESRRENMNEQNAQNSQHRSLNPPPMLPSAKQGTPMDQHRHSTSSGSVAISMEGSTHNQLSSQHQAMQLVEKQNNFLTQRADTMETIETTIVELGNIFQQLSTMVKEQEEQVMRIDSDIGESELNVEAAHTEILKYFKGITSNRWLIIKVFLVLIVFFIIFVVFFA